MFDGKAFGEEIVSIVKGYVENSLTSIIARLDDMEKRLGQFPSKEEFGEGLLGVKEMVAEQVFEFSSQLTSITDSIKELPEIKDGRDGKDGKDGVDGIDGKSIDIEDIRPLIVDEVASAVLAVIKATPLPKDGKDGKDGVDGKSVTIEELTPIVGEFVRSAVSDLPPAEKGEDGKNGIDGKSVTLEEVIPLVNSAVADAMSQIPPVIDGVDGKDGVGLAGAIIDRNNHLILTLTDGTLKDLGKVVGSEGLPGKDGKDGLDGFGFEDLSVEYDGERSLQLVFTRGEEVKTFTVNLPIPIDRGPYKHEHEYVRGDVVSWGGQAWIAQKDTQARPGEGGDWRLSVKKGRDGKDGERGPKGEQGLQGRPGKDLTVPLGV